jgi:hypothetical protein
MLSVLALLHDGTARRPIAWSPFLFSHLPTRYALSAARRRCGKFSLTGAVPFDMPRSEENMPELLGFGYIWRGVRRHWTLPRSALERGQCAIWCSKVCRNGPRASSYSQAEPHFPEEPLLRRATPPPSTPPAPSPSSALRARRIRPAWLQCLGLPVGKRLWSSRRTSALPVTVCCNFSH